MIKRYKIIVEYDGTTLAGWMFQPDKPSVQSYLEEAGRLFCGGKVETYAAGRTDAGVHAKGMAAHIDVPGEFPAFTVMKAMNFYLHDMGAPVAIIDAEEVTLDFHARFSAKRRHYLYIIENRSPHIVLDYMRAWRVVEKLDIGRMQEAANYMLGTHDFTSFRSVECQAKSPLRTLDTITVERIGSQVHINTSARSFLHRQVRNMVGTLKLVGDGSWEPDCIPEILEARDRTKAGPAAAAHGLYFMKVDYE